jgi:hypothetical protein
MKRGVQPSNHFGWALPLALAASLPVFAQPADPHAGHQAPQKKQARPAGPHAVHRGAKQQVTPAADPQAGHGSQPAGNSAAGGPRTLPPLPVNLPDWMTTRQRGHVFYKRGPYNFAIYDIPNLARDLNAVAVGHAMAYEDLVTGKAAGLETETFNRINWVLNHPPRLMPDEAAISPTFGRKYGVLEMMFDWTHVLHAQTIDVLASTRVGEAEKDREIEALWRYYFDSVPWKITPLPMNMGYLDSQPYSGAFRKKYPKVNGLFWGYHWLQGAMYDLLYGKSLEEQRVAYARMGQQYHTVERQSCTGLTGHSCRCLPSSRRALPRSFRTSPTPLTTCTCSTIW